MSELDFKHNVHEVPAGEKLPDPIKRSVSAQTYSIPDLQGAATNYGDATNWMSKIGSQVATRASNAIAEKLGSELGQKPEGNIGIPLTEFDQVMQKSYEHQAQATLGLQANKLISESNIEMAKAPRITPDLISRTNKSIAIGLQNIFKNAPTQVKGDLEYHYGSLQINQLQDLNSRMIREQRSDQRDSTIYSSKVNAENALSLGKNGNTDAALQIVESTKKINDSAYATKVLDQGEVKSNVDTVRQSALTGIKINEYEKARSEGKGDEFLKSLADKKPSDISDSDYMSVTNNIMNYVNHQQALRSQHEQLVTSELNVKMAQDINGISNSDLENYRQQVSPLQYENTLFKYIQAKKSYSNQQLSTNELVSRWSDPSAHARAGNKSVDSAFDFLVSNVVQNNKTGNKVSVDEAEVQVALSAGAPVPVFIKTLNNKLTSGNPASIDSAWNQINALRAAEGGHALIGLSSQSEAIAIQYNAKKGSMPDADLAREVTDNILNIKDDVRKSLDNSWNLKLNSKRAGGFGASTSLHNFALKEVGLNKSDFAGYESFAVIYGNDIYQNLKSNFDVARGDYDTALAMTKEYVKQNYGETRFNGKIQTTDKPIERTLGYKDPDVVPFIQNDLVNQLNKNFQENKTDQEYWETKPVEIQSPWAMRETFRKTYNPVEVVRHVQTPNGEKVFHYPVMLVGRPGNSWDVVLNTPNGPRNMFLVAPHQGVISYTPDRKSIHESYMKGSL